MFALMATPSGQRRTEMSSPQWTLITFISCDGRAISYTPDEFGNAAQNHQRNRAVASCAYASSGFDAITGRYYSGNGSPFQDAAGGKPKTNVAMEAKVRPPNGSGWKIAFGDAAFNGCTTEFTHTKDPSKSFTVKRCRHCGSVVTRFRNGPTLRESPPAPRHLPADKRRVWKDCARACLCS